MRLRFCLLALLWPALLPAANWQLVWSQEFNDPSGTAVDPTWWNQETGGGGWGNGELECYTSGTNNCFEDGAGSLIIRAKNESACGGANSYDSARITTQNKFEIYCGRIEARAWVPAGQGLWPAFWMLGRNIGSVGWPACGETDIMETVNQPNNWIQGSLHMTGDNYTWYGQSHLASGNYSDGYHVFTCYWTPSSISYAMDGTTYYTLNQGQPPAWPFNQPSFILANLAVGGGWPGGPNGSTVFPADYKIDYVRVYKDTNLVQAYNGATPNIPGRVENENYDDGGYGLAYMDSDPANKGGAYRLNEWVDIEADPSDSNGNNLCYTTGGEWEQYTVNATVAGNYQVSFTVASAGNGGTYHLTADGVNVTGALTAPNSGGWHSWTTQVAGPFALSAGQHVLRLYLDGVGATGSVANFDCMDFSLVTPTNTPTFTATPTPWPAGSGSGACGQYFNNASLSGLPCGSQTDAQINLGTGFVVSGCGTMSTNYSIRWTGLLEAPLSEAYTLVTNSDDGVRLYITNPATGVESLIIDKWVTQGATAWNGVPPFSFTAGVRYPFRLEYFQGIGGASVSLSWQSPNTPLQLIPANRIYLPAAGCLLPTPTTTPGTCTGWVTNGSAFASAQGVTLTPAGGGLGSAFSPACVNLGADFNRSFKVYFGVPGGADGIDFVLQQDPRGTAALGAGGGAKGYVGPGAISPSVALDLETYNSNGVLQVLEDGSPTNTCAHALGACPYTFPANVADGNEHSYQVAWSAATKTLRLYFDGLLVCTYQRDLVASIFGGNPCAYFGFTAATGGSVNLQYFYEVGCALPSPTPSVSPSPTVTASVTPSRTASPSPSPSATRTATLTVSPSATPSGTATMTTTLTVSPALSPTPTFSVSPPYSATTSPTFSASPSDSPTPTASPSATLTATPSPSATDSPTPTLSGTPTPSVTATPSPSGTPSGTPSLTATPSLTEAPSATASPSATAAPSASASPGPTGTASPTAAASASPTRTPAASPGEGLRVDQLQGQPNPNPGALAVHLTDQADTLELRVYSAAWVRVLDLQAPARGAGWQSLPLRLPSTGVFYAVVTARRGRAEAHSRPVTLMRTD